MPPMWAATLLPHLLGWIHLCLWHYIVDVACVTRVIRTRLIWTSTWWNILGRSTNVNIAGKPSQTHEDYWCTHMYTLVWSPMLFCISALHSMVVNVRVLNRKKNKTKHILSDNRVCFPDKSSAICKMYKIWQFIQYCLPNYARNKPNSVISKEELVAGTDWLENITPKSSGIKHQCNTETLITLTMTKAVLADFQVCTPTTVTCVKEVSNKKSIRKC